MFGLFKKFKDGFSKTVSAITDTTRGLFGGRKIDAASLDQLEEALYTADFGVTTTTEIIDEIKAAYRKDPELKGKQAAEIGAAVLKRVLAGSEGKLDGGPAPSPAQTQRGEGAVSPPTNPTVIAMIGVNGSGKTTTTAKLAWMLKQDGQSVTLAACDTFRAAAVEQLKSWATRLDLEIVASHTGADAAAVAFDAWQAAKSRGRDYLLQKHDETAPQHRWLVVDGSLGSNSIEQARVFHKQFGLTGLVVTKLDGTSRGGAIVGIWRELKLPIYFVGLGEQPEDLQPFSIENYAKAVFGLES
jgi:fused signal recognition particle receptor